MTIPIEEQTNETVGEVDLDIKKKMEERIKQNSLNFSIDSPSNDKVNMDSKFVLKCLEDSTLGCAEIYKKLFRDKFIFNISGNYWLRWCGHYWEEDKERYSLIEVVKVADVFENELLKQMQKFKDVETLEEKEKKAIQTRKKELKKVIKNLKTLVYNKQVLEQVHTSYKGLIIKGDELDKHPWLLACNNGVINLKTGILNKGRPADFLSKHCPIDYPDTGFQTPPEKWEETLLEIFSQNQELVDYFQRLCGYCLVGEVIDHKFIVMCGRGRNGKSLIIETISSILGELVVSIRSEMLLAQHNINSSAPDAGLMRLQGALMAIASETDAGKGIAPAKIKLYSGGDPIVGRNPYDKYEISFQPTHTLFLSTNNKPAAPADDFAFWERMVVIPFDLSFVSREPENNNERKANADLPNQLKKEYPLILSWLVKGCLLWQAKGLSEPAVIKCEVDEYRRSEDRMQDFIDECCVVGDSYKINSTIIYNHCKVWWEKNVSKQGLSHHIFGRKFIKKFDKKKYQTFFYLGVQLREEHYTKEVIT